MSLSYKRGFTLASAGALLAMVVGCSPLQAINALTPRSTYILTESLAYGSGPRQQLDVYTPVDAKGAAPVMVFFYGGNWNSGNRKDYRFVGEALASRGMVAVVADYRVYPEVRYPAFLDDSAAAVAWTVKQVQRYGGDPKRLFVMGHSAGGYNAAMIALDGRWLGKTGATPAILRGWIGLAGPYDFLPIENNDAKPVFFAPDTPVESQPIAQVTADAPSTLLIASNSDRLVDPVRNTGGLARRLRLAGVRVEEVYSNHTGHATLIGSLARPLRVLAPTLDTIEAFVKSDGGRQSPGAGAQLSQQVR